MIGIGWATLYHSMIEKYSKQENSKQQNIINNNNNNANN